MVASIYRKRWTCSRQQIQQQEDNKYMAAFIWQQEDNKYGCFLNSMTMTIFMQATSNYGSQVKANNGSQHKQTMVLNTRK